MTMTVTDLDFNDLVNRDLRGRATPEESSSLRAPDLAGKWLLALTRIQRSVEGQLASMQEDFLSRRAEIKLYGSPQMHIELIELQKNHSAVRAGKLRFKTGLEEALVEARAIVDELRGSHYDSLVASERNYYAEQRGRLQEAIRRHQAETLADDLEPSEFDERLWEVLDGS